MNILKIFFISAVPLVEQRGAIPYGIFVLNMNPALVFVISYLGSLFPVPFILFLFNALFVYMKKFKFLARFNSFIDNKVKKGAKKIEKYAELGLITFVAIPLPTTGLWTGSAAAAFLGLDKKKSFLCIALGGLISAIVITLLCIYFPYLFK